MPDLTDDEFNNFDWTRWHYEGKHFEARAVSRSEFEALKRFGDYEELPNSILMRIEGDKEFRIYCDDVEKWSFGLITPGFCSMLEEAYDEMHGRNKGSKIVGGEGRVRQRSLPNLTLSEMLMNARRREQGKFVSMSFSTNPPAASSSTTRPI